MSENDGTRPVLGVIGFGKLGTAVARLGLAAGYTVRAAGSGEPEVVKWIADVVAPGAQAGLAGDVAAGSDIVILALPLHRFRELRADDLAGKLVVDAMNHWPEDDGPRELWAPTNLSTSEVVQRYFSNASVVKGLSHIGYHDLEGAGRPRGERTRKAMALAGDDVADVARVAEMVDNLGFDPLPIGPLREGRRLESGGPAFGAVASVAVLSRALGLVSAPPSAEDNPSWRGQASTGGRPRSLAIAEVN